MSPELGPDLPLEIAHVLLIDAVGYSKLLVNGQIELLQELNQIVRSTECFRTAEKTGVRMAAPNSRWDRIMMKGLVFGQLESLFDIDGTGV